MNLQCGNRGFGHLANAVIIITSDLSSWNVSTEQYAPYIDGGMMAMNLLYSLHYHKIAACPLNWSEKKKKNRILHKILNIPSNEIAIMFISCGYAPNEFNVVRSKRKESNEILRVH